MRDISKQEVSDFRSISIYVFAFHRFVFLLLLLALPFRSDEVVTYYRTMSNNERIHVKALSKHKSEMKKKPHMKKIYCVSITTFFAERMKLESHLLAENAHSE